VRSTSCWCGCWTGWGRSVTDLLATLQELEDLGVGFVSLTAALRGCHRRTSGALTEWSRNADRHPPESVRRGCENFCQNPPPRSAERSINVSGKRKTHRSREFAQKGCWSHWLKIGKTLANALDEIIKFSVAALGFVDLQLAIRQRSDKQL
jgi:hypothetical protein